MAAEPGGIASKLGTFYERRYAADLLLRLIMGLLVRLRWEPASGDAGGADIELEYANGVIEHVQLKRQNQSDALWNVAALEREGVLSAAAQVLEKSQTNRFTFVSADPVPHLKDICDQLHRSSDSSAVFIENRVHSQKKRKAVFEELLRRWGFEIGNVDHESNAIQRLRSMQWILLDRSRDGWERLLTSVQQTLTGDPDNAIAQLFLFLEDRLGRDVNQQDLLEYLKSKKILPRDLSRDPAIPSAIQLLRDEFRSSLRDRLVAGNWLNRPQATNVVDRVIGNAPPRVILIHGKPGVGKSGVLLGITDALIARGVPLLPLSLNTHTPEGSVHQFGESLGLHASPVAALRATSGSGRTVFLVDQLDALRLTTSAATAIWQICTLMLNAAASDPDMVLIVACRTFDLDHDANIRRWKESIERAHPGMVMTVDVNDLTPADIEPVLRSVGVDYSTLPARLQRLLLHPNTLHAWYRLVKHGSTRRDFATHTQLLSELIDALRQEAVRDHPVQDSDIYAALTTAQQYMELHGRLAAPISIFDSGAAALHACIAVGLLTKNSSTVSFPHQSYFDYLVARAALRSSGHSPEGIVRWIKLDQSLQRRDQLRQLLFMFRDEESSVAARVMGLILFDPNVRFHLKQLACGVLREVDPITNEDVELVLRLVQQDEWSEHVRGRVLWRSLAWFDELQARGVWARWLAEFTGERRVSWLYTLTILADQRPQELDRLLEPLLRGADGKALIGRVLPFDPSNDTPLMADLRDSEVRAGRWAVIDLSLERIAERYPVRAVRLVENTLRGALRRALTPRLSDDDERIHEFRDEAFDKNVAKAVRLQSVKSYTVFSRLLLVCERLKLGCHLNTEDEDGTGIRDHWNSSFITNISEILTNLVAEAVAGLSELDGVELQTVLDSQRVQKSSTTLAAAVCTGLGRASSRVADAALRWLCAQLERLPLNRSLVRDQYALAADLIRRHAAHGSEDTLAFLVPLLLKYYPVRERDHYRFMLEYLTKGTWGFFKSGRYHPHVNPIGRAQHLLLSAIPDNRRPSNAKDRIQLWDSKFGGPAVERPACESRGGWVGSPIPEDRITRVSDRQWLDIMSRRWTSRRWKQLGPERVAEASHDHFADDLGKAAKLEPGRFVHLSQRFSPDVPPIYLARLWDALAEPSSEISSCETKELNTLLDKTASTGDRGALVSACRAIEHHPHDWSEESMWNLLKIATVHEEPKSNEYTVSSPDGGKKHRDIEMTSLNCVRGVVASALGTLAWDNKKKAARVLPLAQGLAADPHPAIRVAAAHTATGIYTVDKNDGAALLMTIVTHDDDNILVGRWISKLVRFVRWSHPNILHPTFYRMADSSVVEVAESGAGWVTAEHFQCAKCSDKYMECRNGTVHQRAGVARALCSLLLKDGVDPALVETNLVHFFNDTASEVRKAAAEVFRLDGIFRSDAGSRVAGAFVNSPAFVDKSELFTLRLVDELFDLPRYAPVVLAAADRFASDLAEQTRNMQNRLGIAGREVSTLLLRLYDGAIKRGDQPLAASCLDRWDNLLANRVGAVEEHLETLVG